MKRERKIRNFQMAVLADLELQRLYAGREKIYAMSIPKVMLKNGIPEMIYIDESNNLQISAIDEIIKDRVEQIKRFYPIESNRDSMWIEEYLDTDAMGNCYSDADPGL